MNEPRTEARIPYTTEDGTEIYLPVSLYTLNEARKEAASFAAEHIGDWGRSRYTGKQDVALHAHEDWWDCQECPAQLSWCFETYEGTYRR